MILTWLNKKVNNSDFNVFFCLFLLIGGIAGSLVGYFTGDYMELGLVLGSMAIFLVGMGTDGIGWITWPFYLLFILFGSSLHYGFDLFQIPIWITLVVSFIIVEVLFLLDKEKPKKKENKIWFAVKRKLECIAEVFFGLGVFNLILFLIRIIIPNAEPIVEVFKWIGIIALSILGIIGYFAINSLKYRRNKK